MNILYLLLISILILFVGVLLRHCGYDYASDALVLISGILGAMFAWVYYIYDELGE
jgi:TRAP-type C4-dicarboxylate transport system permease small subunit